MKRLRVVLDANVLAPGLLSSKSSSAEVIRLWRLGVFDVLVTGKLVEEVAQTLRALGLDNSEIIGAIELLGSNPETIVPLKHQTFGCEDPDDDYLFETAVVGEAAVIVSRDKDLQKIPAQLRIMLETRAVRVMDDVEFLGYVRGRAFSPLAFDDRYVRIDELLRPIEDSQCVLCGHGFHWDVPCGETFSEELGEPWTCECPARIGLHPV